jgi:hypothetical protein
VKGCSSVSGILYYAALREDGEAGVDEEGENGEDGEDVYIYRVTCYGRVV